MSVLDAIRRQLWDLIIYARIPTVEETSIKLQGDFSKSDFGVNLRNSFYRALEMNHKLPKWITRMHGMSGRKYRSLINSLIESFSNARYLEIGSWRGSSACSAMWGNKATIVCIDNWSEFNGLKDGFIFNGPKDDFINNINKAKNININFKLIENDFRKVNYSKLEKMNVYFFDGPHSESDQYDGIVMVQPALDETYILIIDDFNWAVVRKGTLRAISDLNLKIECSIEIKTGTDDLEPTYAHEMSDWHNGYFIAVVRKQNEVAGSKTLP